ncbi:amylo-alpha-1,6-glucosidase [Hyphomicrobium sp. LHD-15]|uniref:amylo-alpha-1,6-glucosidase n=1 Tax=Hyphomicrobium sp. LHD-15 TaxID=3072142 RepID=UPI00280D5C6C|nr:amylo-alpha-1,6-glucosidase [Hyphomicrobium sp. LHD-15]MDQ8698150.1 amylo-alpha-1,6-glucosidase [Hyphomicrobium sp. LHD-15]
MITAKLTGAVDREHDDSDYHIDARTSLTERTLRTLKHGDAFAVLDAYGDLGVELGTPEGIYFRDMRFLSRMKLICSGQRPLLLSSVIHDDNSALSIDLTNADIEPPGRPPFARNTIAISRTKFLWNAASYERIALRNYDALERLVSIELLFDADFVDLFEVRGMPRAKRGRITIKRTAADAIQYVYDGLDGVQRRTTLTFAPMPKRLDLHRAVFERVLEAGERSTILVTASFDESDEPDPPVSFHSAYRAKRKASRSDTENIATIESSNPLFDELMCRSTADIYTLSTRAGEELYPYAGIPWYNTVFGRDGIITAMMMLWIDPAIARGVLLHLAETQATHHDPGSDAQPGKILHERRSCEMAQLGEIPFRRYYGTVDATPLFVMLAGLYFERTGDVGTLQKIWLNVKAALEWCDVFGDRDGDGFVEYLRETPNGLANQGWKDSHDSVFHADGSQATGPIALVEVQAYVFGAKRQAAKLAQHFGETAMAERLSQAADDLQARFQSAFWCEDIGTYALALDGDKRPCKVVTSNAGHSLFTGIATLASARKVVASLMRRTSFSGWGIRTVAHNEARHNPMSYHNGSVWPHDNALIALGFDRYGFKAESAALFEAIFEAVGYQQDRRLPELFCGFTRRSGRGPIAYPVACSPQAWAAVSPFAFLGACLGVSIEHAAERVRFIKPTLPSFLNEVVVRRIVVGNSRLDVRVARHGTDVSVNITGRVGNAQAIIVT